MSERPEPPTHGATTPLLAHQLSQHIAVIGLAGELAEIALRRNDTVDALARILVLLHEVERVRDLIGSLRCQPCA